MTTDTPVNVGKYQLMPDMTPEQYQELKEDIRKRGVLSPIEFDEQGQIIDGHHRFRAFSELIEEGADVPLYDKVVRKFASEQEKYEYVISFNVKRRHLTPEQRRDLAVKLRKPPYSYTLSKVAELLGVSTKTIWYDLDSLSATEKQELEEATKVITSSDGKIRPTSYAPRLFVTGQTQLRTMQMDLINEAAKRIQAQGYATETTEEALVIHSNGDAKGATLQAISQVIPTSEENVQEATQGEDKESIVREVLTQLADEEASVRYSAFSWYGGKGAHLNWLLPLLPPAKHFVDVYGGSAAVVMNRTPVSPIETYNDLDSNLVNFFKVLRDDTEKLVRAVCLTPYSREERRYAYRQVSKTEDPIEKARLFFVLARQSRSGIVQRLSGGDINSWKWARDSVARGMSSNISQWRSGLDGLAAVASRFSRIQIENYPALRVIELYDTPDTLFYCDPPYLHDTRVRGHDDTYSTEMTRDDHIALAHALNKIKGRAAVSGYPSDLYDELYKSWHRVDMPTTMTVNSGETDKQRIECLWTNYRTL